MKPWFQKMYPGHFQLKHPHPKLLGFLYILGSGLVSIYIQKGEWVIVAVSGLFCLLVLISMAFLNKAQMSYPWIQLKFMGLAIFVPAIITFGTIDYNPPLMHLSYSSILVALALYILGGIKQIIAHFKSRH